MKRAEWLKHSCRERAAVLRRSNGNLRAVEKYFCAVAFLANLRGIVAPQRIAEIKKRLEPFLVHAMSVILDLSKKNALASLASGCEGNSDIPRLRIERIA